MIFRRTAIIVATIALLIGIIATGASAKDNITVRIDVDRTTCALGETINATVSVSGAGLRSVPSPQLRDPEMFQVVGTSSSQNFSMMNTKISVEKQTIYALAPLRTGRARIGPATVKVRGKEYRSNTVQVQIVDSSAVTPQGSPGGEAVEKPVFLRAVVEPSDTYLGAPVTLSLYIYTRAQLTGLSFSSLPDFTNFWAEELLAPQRPSFQETEIESVPYRVALLRRYALFPLQAGTNNIEPFAVNAEVVSEQRRRRKTRNWPFDDDFFGSALGRRQTVELVTEPISINVAPLPTEDRPEYFEGAVGRFKMTLALDKTKTKSAEPVTLEVAISGEGNFKTLPAPKIALPTGFDTFSESSSLDLQNTPDTVRGKKTFTSILIPREEGVFDIGPVILDYFDPVEKVYKRLTAGPVKLAAIGKGKTQVAGNLPVAQQEVTLAGRDIRYIRADAQILQEVRSPYYAGAAFLALVLCWPPLILILYGLRRYRRAAAADVTKSRLRKAGRVSRTRLKKARALLDAEPAEFYLELTGALMGYVADKLDTSAAGIVVRELLDKLTRAGAPDETTGAFRELFREADAIRYGGAPSDHDSRKLALEKAMSVLEDLDRGKWLKEVRP
jgi:BatD DUF11 like domain